MSSGSISIELDYKPRKQFLPFHQRKTRWALIVAHRRAGKTVAVLNDMVIRALEMNDPKRPDPFFAYLAPYFGQAKQASWMYLKAAVRKIPGCKISESELTITLPNTARIRVFGADNADALRGLYFDGIVLDEFGDMEGRVWSEVVRSALADRKGWAVFIGTPKGHNKFYELRERARATPGRWFYLELKASQSGILPASELAEMAEEMDEHERAQELECNFDAALRGSYYGEHVNMLEQRGKFRADSQFDPSYPVSCAHDPGRDDAWAIWFWQVIAGEVRFIDYFEETGYDAQEVLDVLDLRYPRYETMWLPHDALHKTAQSRKSILDQFREADVPARKVPDPDGGGAINGINAVRKVLRTYPIVFDAVKCSRGLMALRSYSRKWNPDAKVFAEKAKHDEWSHGADAFRYACLSISPEAIANSIEKAKCRPKSGTPQSINTEQEGGWTFNDALAAHKQQAAQQRHAMKRI